VDPKRGEIWLVNLDPTRGDEINKTRPAAVISSDTIRTLRLRLVAPITGWNQRFTHSFWHIRLIADQQNNLDKDSAADMIQVRSLALPRFVKYIGRLRDAQVESMVIALAAVTEYK
jgi:mRNA interferase MazF